MMMAAGRKGRGRWGNAGTHITYQNDVGSDPHGSTALVPSVSLVLGPLWLCMCGVCVNREVMEEGSQKKKANASSASHHPSTSASPFQRCNRRAWSQDRQQLEAEILPEHVLVPAVVA